MRLAQRGARAGPRRARPAGRPGNEISPAWRRRSCAALGEDGRAARRRARSSGTSTAASVLPGASIAAASSGLRSNADSSEGEITGVVSDAVDDDRLRVAAAQSTAFLRALGHRGRGSPAGGARRDPRGGRAAVPGALGGQRRGRTTTRRGSRRPTRTSSASTPSAGVDAWTVWVPPEDQRGRRLAHRARTRAGRRAPDHGDGPRRA